MLLPPRIIAVDDELPHLQGIVTGLNRSGWACLQIHFPNDMASVQPCSHVRLVFTDLHLVAGGATVEMTRNYSAVQSLLETKVIPTGPYLLVVWTRYPEDAQALEGYLRDRMVKKVPAPLSVLSLAKESHLDASGNVTDPDKLVAALRGLVNTNPQFSALLNWEQRVLGAAAAAVSEMQSLTKGAAPTPTLAQVIAQLASAAVGKQNVDTARFQAVNEALLPILADLVGSLRRNASDDTIWAGAFAPTDLDVTLTDPVAARLNRFVHVEQPFAAGGCYRGAVVKLPGSMSGKNFSRRFTIEPQGDVAKKQFGIKPGSGPDAWEWRLVQVQAACDVAQKNPGPLPFVLAAEVKRSGADRNPLKAAWKSPWFTTPSGDARLMINPRFLIDVPASTAARFKSVYRLREQIMVEVSHHIQAQGARPGIISF
jgi:hypothetical protein